MKKQQFFNNITNNNNSCFSQELPIIKIKKINYFNKKNNSSVNTQELKTNKYKQYIIKKYQENYNNRIKLNKTNF